MKKTLQNQIATATRKAEALGIRASFAITDNSTQAELRLRATWAAGLDVDQITAPQDLADTADSRELWQLFRNQGSAAERAARQLTDSIDQTEAASARTKTGQAARAALLADFESRAVKAFAAGIKMVSVKRRLADARQRISEHQAEQKNLLTAMRRSNSEYLSSRKSAKAAERAADAAALESGEFWRATKAALKDYFHPPFAKNFLADVSERWRAALYLECKSISYKTGYGWRHKLAGTGRAYLCGIDDNGDEWGHEIRLDLGVDYHYNLKLQAAVEDAVAGLFGVSVSALENCQRQGDLLFRPCTILKSTKQVCNLCGKSWEPHNDNGTIRCGFCWASDPGTRTITPPTLEPETEWEVRESHRVLSPSLRHNGRYFAADDEIRVEHTSHQPVILPPGEYCLHPLLIADAD